MDYKAAIVWLLDRIGDRAKLKRIYLYMHEIVIRS